MYPERYTATELEVLAENQAAVPMVDLAQFGEYHRQFVTKADWLSANSKILQWERGKMFLDGLHVDFRNQVKVQLRLVDPMHPLDRPWTVTQIEEAAKFLLEGSYTVAYPALPSQPAQPSYPAYVPLTAHPSYSTYIPTTQPAQLPSFTTQISLQPPAATLTAPAPRDTFDMSAMQQFLATVNALINKLNAKLDQIPAPASTQQTRSFNSQQSPPQDVERVPIPVTLSGPVLK
jgi:hypothetical protein